MLAQVQVLSFNWNKTESQQMRRTVIKRKCSIFSKITQIFFALKFELIMIILSKNTPRNTMNIRFFFFNWEEKKITKGHRFALSSWVYDNVLFLTYKNIVCYVHQMIFGSLCFFCVSD